MAVLEGLAEVCRPSLLARDRFMPRQFATRGDKLVFSNGIIILAVFSGVIALGLLLNGCSKCGPFWDDWVRSPQSCKSDRY
jgi:hypothetical protein